MVEIIAHRGASRDRLENTRAAFALAIEQHADAIELDVHLTADGVVVVHHDPHLVADHTGDALPIALADIERLRRNPLANGETIPTLDEVLDLVGLDATLYVEVKASHMERQLVECLERHPGARVAVHSFDHRIPTRVRALRPGTQTGLLSASYPLDMAGFIGVAAPDVLWQEKSMVDRNLVRDALQIGARTIVWTENDPERARRLEDLGVSAICTDVPATIRRSLESRQSSQAVT